MEQLCQFFLFFSKEIGIGITFLLGYFFYNKKVFFQALVLALTGIVIAASLKSIFKVPLMPHLGEGWAFPSGHMFVSTIFWGFLAFEVRNTIFSFLAGLILTGIAIGLLYLNYHLWVDVSAAVACAFIFVALYKLLLRVPICYESQTFLSSLMFGVACFLTLLMPKIYPHLKISLSKFLGIVIGSFLLSWFKGVKKDNQIIEFILCLMGAILIYYLSFFTKNFTIGPISLLYVVLGIWIIFGPRFILSLLTSSRKKVG